MSNKVVLPDFFLNNNNNIQNRLCVRGTCKEMCPPEEVTLRKKEKLVHILEVTQSGHKLVKSYCRSAADSNMAVPCLLRPFEILSQTVHYLLLEVPKRSDVKMSVIYDFLNDRLRAVRQDMIIQRLPPEQFMLLLEPMIRFYAYYGYRLCCHPLREYDPELNKKYLLECVKWFLSCCDILHKAENIDDDINAITGHIKSLDIRSTSQQLSCDRVLVESLYILCNLDDIHPLYRYLCLPNYLKRATALKLAYNIAIANMNGNYIRVLKLAKRLCPLNFSVVCLYHTTIQRRALQVMSHAYSSKQLAVRMSVLRQWLCFNTDDEVRAACAHYGLMLVKEKNAVCFSKTSFIEAEQPQPTMCCQAKILHLELEDVLSYTV